MPKDRRPSGATDYVAVRVDCPRRPAIQRREISHLARVCLIIRVVVAPEEWMICTASRGPRNAHHVSTVVDRISFTMYAIWSIERAEIGYRITNRLCATPRHRRDG